MVYLRKKKTTGEGGKERKGSGQMSINFNLGKSRVGESVFTRENSNEVLRKAWLGTSKESNQRGGRMVRRKNGGPKKETSHLVRWGSLVSRGRKVSKLRKNRDKIKEHITKASSRTGTLF